MAVEILTIQEAALPTEVLLRMAMLSGTEEPLTADELKQSTEQLLRQCFVKVDGQMAVAGKGDGGGVPGSYDPPIPSSDVTGLVAALAARLADNAPSFVFDTATDTDVTSPPSGQMKFNDATIADVTEIALDASVNGVDKGDLFTNIGGVMQGRLIGTGTTFEFRITGVVFGLWTRYTVVYLKGALPADGDAIALRFLPPPTPLFTGITSIAINGSDLEVSDGVTTFKIPLNA